MFGTEGWLWRVLSKIADIVILSVLFVGCSLPIFTMGAATSALYASCLKLSDEKEGYIIRDYFKSFKKNFKDATILWLILIAVGAVLLVDLYAVNQMGGFAKEILRYVFLVLISFYLIVLSYTFPIQSKFNMNIVQVIKYSLLFGIGNLVPWTFLIIFMNMIPIILFVFSVNFFLYIQPFVLGFLLGGIAYANSKIFNHIFEKIAEGDKM